MRCIPWHNGFENGSVKYTDTHTNTQLVYGHNDDHVRFPFGIHRPINRRAELTLLPLIHDPCLQSYSENDSLLTTLRFF
jgi:hypothetical protein